MVVDWKLGFNPAIFTQKLEKAKILDEAGKLSFEAFEYVLNSIPIQNMIDCGIDFSEEDKKRIINEAIATVGKKGVITPPKLLRTIKTQIRNFQNLPEKKYCFITTMTSGMVSNFKTVRYLGGTLSFNTRLKGRFDTNYNKICKDYRHLARGKPSDYPTFTKITIRSKTISDAFNKSFVLLNNVRGIWNFSYNRRYSLAISSGARKPINKITLGPIASLHYPDGSLATPSCMYNHDYISAGHRFKPSDIEMMNKFFLIIKKYLNKSNYKNEILNAINRYTTALDNVNYENAFLKLWGVLECLTNTLHDNYKVTIRRASFLYSEREYFRQILNHLREYRNQSVHLDIENLNVENDLYLLKNTVESLIWFHLSNSFKFNSLKQAAEFMDLPSDISQIRSRKKMLVYAEKFLTGN